MNINTESYLRRELRQPQPLDYGLWVFTLEDGDAFCVSGTWQEAARQVKAEAKKRQLTGITLAP